MAKHCIIFFVNLKIMSILSKKDVTQTEKAVKKCTFRTSNAQ